MNDRDFKGVWIPKQIWLSKELNILEKVILMEIDSLTKDGEACYASNEHIAEFCQCSERKVSEAVAKLIELGYIEHAGYDGRKRFLSSKICEGSKICESESQKMRNSNTNEYNSIYIPNTNNTHSTSSNSSNSTKHTQFIKPTVDDVKQYCTERNNTVDANKFIDYYTSNGWRVGKNPMKDWKAAVRTWERSGYNNAPAKEEPKERPEWAKRIKRV